MTTMMVEENKFEKSNAGGESIKYYCRVCISNTKTKKAKSEDSIGIFKRAGLKSILEKYLHLQISEDDQLPKVICKLCFDKLMAIEFLQIVARRTETLFKDYIVKKTAQDLTTSQVRHHDGYANSNSFATPKVEDVVVNVSMSDPLTKNIKKKLQVAQNPRDSIGTAFSPEYLSRNAVTSSPLTQVPVTIVHRMPKKRKIPQKPLESSQTIQSPPQTNATTTTVTLENLPKTDFVPLRPKMKATLPLRHISEAPTIPQNVEIHPVVSGNPPAMGHGMPLGSIIKDEDLLKLILKALKWPYNSQTLDIQIQRLKDTNFNDIIVDPNLLQDTDLIQILGPLLGPLPVTMQQQTYHITIPPDIMSSPPTTMSYKLPAETSVQIITVPAMVEKETSSSNERHQETKRYIKATLTRKKLGKTSVSSKKLREQVIVVSDESEDDLIMPTKIPANNDDIPSFGVQLDPAVYPSVEDNSNSNETMLATLNRQREAMMRMHRSKRKQSLKCAKNVEMVDDIMIVDEGFHMTEPYPDVVLLKKNRRSHEAPPIAASTSQYKTVLNTALAAKEFERMNQALPPVVTKPEPTTIASPTPLIQHTLESSNSNSKPTKKLSVDAAEKPPAARGFVKLKGAASSLPPLKKVKLVPRATPSYANTPKESLKHVQASKNTTVAHADSTTKIMVKETKVPQPPKPPSADIEDQISKVKIGKQVQNSSTSSGGKTSGGPIGHTGDKEEAFIIVECEEECKEKAATKQVVKAKTKKLKKDVASLPRPEAKKSDFRILGTFEISDDDMEPLVVEEASEEPLVEEPASAVSEGERSPLKKMKTAVQEDSPSIETSQIVEINPAAAEEEKEKKNIELPAIEIEVKAEENEVQIKNEDIESMNASRIGKSDVNNESPKRHFVASKTAVKSEVQKSTRSTTKRKVLQPKEEPILETTTFRPARKSKTLSKYYKGPPLSGTETPGRSMRSRT